MTAWSRGITGRNETIAIVDTGIDRDSPEFTGRIHPDSRDVAGNAGFDAIDDHGTNVAMVAAAARDNTGILGIAFDARVLVLRADRPGSCTATETDGDLAGCQFFDRDIASGVDQAIASRAAVVNLSLGGSRPTQVLIDAVRRASAAGVVVVVSAGNSGDGSDPAIPPDQPDPFASGILAAGGSNVIIVGSVDDNGQFSGFSNRAGNDAASFIAARGERICCVYKDGQLEITTDSSGNRFVTLFSGTSFSAPQVAGAVALLKQAFPNLTGQQIVRILLDTARDAGAAGTDATFGRGILDIARAVSPQGTTTLAGSAVAIELGNDTGTASAAMGDALGGQSLSSVVLDSYRRAYNYDLGTRLRGAAIVPRLEGAVQLGGRRVSAGNETVSMAFTIDAEARPAFGSAASPLFLSGRDAEMARVLAGQVALRIAPDMQLGFAFSQSSDGLAAHLQGKRRPAFLIAGDATGDSGFLRADQGSVAIRRDLGATGLTVTGTTGEALLGTRRQADDVQSRDRERYGIARLGVAADRRFGPVQAVVSVDWLREDRTVLGGYFHDAFGAGGADSLFVDASVGIDVAPGWWVGAEARQGFTRARRSGAISAGSDLASTAWAFDIVRQGVLQRSDTLGFRLAQPLRVESGGLRLDLPVAYDYTVESATFDVRRLNLSPGGRELLGELAWRGELLGGDMAASAFYRRDPGHYADVPDDRGVVMRWIKEF
ncbi:S8 family peptidase [Parerythrobacter aurantius]|uniref:S8 family peptidase n=1 Tax=Parerythrobacter aurantius TaxID=3127706 RepID=UPI00324DCB2C